MYSRGEDADIMALISRLNEEFTLGYIEQGIGPAPVLALAAGTNATTRTSGTFVVPFIDSRLNGSRVVQALGEHNKYVTLTSDMSPRGFVEHTLRINIEELQRHYARRKFTSRSRWKKILLVLLFLLLVLLLSLSNLETLLTVKAYFRLQEEAGEYEL